MVQRAAHKEKEMEPAKQTASLSTTPAPQATPSFIHLKAKLTYTGTQLQITNLDKFDWLNCKFEINGGFFSSGYILKAPLIQAKHTYKVGIMQFAKSDGSRFNPFSTKIQQISGFCETLDNKHGSWFVSGE